MKSLKKLVDNGLVDHIEKCDHFSDFLYAFRSSRLTTNLVSVTSKAIARAFNRSGPTRVVALHLTNIFDRV